MQLVAWVLLQLENEGQDKRVESVWFPCADEGSTPSSSTMLRQRGLTLVRVLRKRSDYVDYDSLQLHYPKTGSIHDGVLPAAVLTR